MIFTDENGGAAGASLRRFRVDDLVRFRPQTRVRVDYNIAADEVGKVVGVEPHPPATGPTYKIQVQFERALVPYVFRFEYELVQAAPDAAESPSPKCEDEMKMSDPEAIIVEFCTICASVRTDYDLYRSLFESDRRNWDLYTSVAPLCFGDLRRILAENQFLQFSKITDPAKTGKKSNLTTNFILEGFLWPDDVGKKLREINERLKKFRQYIEPARSKRIAHVDFSAQIEQWGNLGAFPKGADKQFLQDLQTFVNIAYGHFHDGAHCSIEVAMSTDTHQLVRALEKAVIFDRCSKCNSGERAVAVLDYEDRTE
ncbi:MAG: hypothetical protein ACRD36_00680 [Candidatus Acidiferrum sp.]